MKSEDKKYLLIAGGIVGAYFLIVNPILKKLGLKTSANVIQAQTDPGSPFNPNMWRKVSGAQLLKMDTTKLLAKRIHDAFGVFYDDFNAVMSAIKSCKYKTQISWLCDVFQQQYNQDMFTFLTNGGGIMPWDGLGDAQVQQILNYVNNLPKTK
jgi:hypothetical protein